jgi:hypothetical protein
MVSNSQVFLLNLIRMEADEIRIIQTADPSESLPLLIKQSELKKISYVTKYFDLCRSDDLAGDMEYFYNLKHPDEMRDGDLYFNSLIFLRLSTTMKVFDSWVFGNCKSRFGEEIVSVSIDYGLRYLELFKQRADPENENLIASLKSSYEDLKSTMAKC